MLVYKENQHVADLHRVSKGCEFRYIQDFLESNQPAIALHLPKTRDGIRVEGIANLPTYFAGLLPEGVMFNAVKRLLGSASDDLFAVLAATGGDAIGDIETRIPGEMARKPSMTLAEAKEQIKSLLAAETSFPMDHLAAISGAQPKLSVGQLVRASRTSNYIAKFDSTDFPDLIWNEFALTRLARLCRMDVSETKLLDGVLVIKRFDRHFDSIAREVKKIHVEDMLQAMDMFPNSKYSVEYVDLLASMQDLGVAKSTLLDALELYVFSYIIGNGDLHAKNVSLVLDNEDGQWRLSPVYDVLTTLPYESILPGAERMALALSDDNSGRFTVEEFIDVGERFGLPAKAVLAMVDRTSKSVFKFLPDAAQHYLSPEVTEIIIQRAESLAVRRA